MNSTENKNMKEECLICNTNKKFKIYIKIGIKY